LIKNDCNPPADTHMVRSTSFAAAARLEERAVVTITAAALRM
jgi:hypothetical protein